VISHGIGYVLFKSPVPTIQGLLLREAGWMRPEQGVLKADITKKTYSKDHVFLNVSPIDAYKFVRTYYDFTHVGQAESGKKSEVLYKQSDLQTCFVCVWAYNLGQVQFQSKPSKAHRNICLSFVEPSLSGLLFVRFVQILFNRNL